MKNVSQKTCAITRRQLSSFGWLVGSLVPVLIAALTSAAQVSTTASAGQVAADDYASIAGQAFTKGGAFSFLEELSDDIGGRVTGSDQSLAASKLILKTLHVAGYDNAHFEEYSLGSRWRRGPAVAHVVSPVTQPLLVGSYGWVPGTAGEIRVPIADLGTPSSEAPISSDLRGAAALVDLQSSGSTPLPVTRALIARHLAHLGAAVMLIPSDKPDRMLYTSAYGFYPRGPLPVLSIGREDALFLRRLLRKGPVTISLDVKNTFDMSTGIERNVIADLPGTNPDELVLVGAHFDSWDLAQGADDNGSGVAAVLDAARILKSAVKPRFTIRFAFFSGEEQANLGSRAYVEQHRTELDGLRAFIMMDDGSQRPLGFNTNGREDLVAALHSLLEPLAALGADNIYSDADMDSDNASFMVVGVPALTLKVEPGDYDNRDHAITDTFDKIDPRNLGTATAVIAISAYAIANANKRPGRRLSQPEVRDLLNKTGLGTAQETLFGPLGPESDH